MRKLVMLGTLALAMSSPVLARADILDPSPVLGGLKSSRVATVSGVMTAGGLGTFFSCTNLSPSPAVMSVELYTRNGLAACNDASAVATTVPPGGTVLFSTQNTASSSFTGDVPLMTPPQYLEYGSASIISTNKNVVCSARIVDVNNSPPLTMMRLDVFKKNKWSGS
jgi:hypothetical protein